MNYATVNRQVPVEELLAKAGLDLGEGSSLNDHISFSNWEELSHEGAARGARADAAIAAIVAKA